MRKALLVCGLLDVALAVEVKTQAQAGTQVSTEALLESEAQASITA